MSRGGLKRRLGWLEGVLYVAGAVLLAVFAWVRFDANRQAEAALEAFEASLVPPAAAIAGADDERPPVDLDAPNVELWAEKRIRQYRESLGVETEPPLAVMSIDTLDIHVPVFNGADEFNLNRGVARIIGTARVGEDGNLGIAGHRDGFFRGLKDIAIGDTIELRTARGTEVYAVSSIDIVEPSEVSVLGPTAEKTLTLVTCYPFYYVGHAPQRYIVKAKAEHLLASN